MVSQVMCERKLNSLDEVVKAKGFCITGNIHVGSLSAVYVAIHISSNTDVVLKVFPIQSKNDYEHYSRELAITQYLAKEDCSVSIFDHFEADSWGIMVLESLPYDLLHLSEISKFSETDLKIMFKQICVCIFNCHRQNIIHLDIKPENFLVTYDYNLKLCDYGSARSSGYTLGSSNIGTSFYRAPEIKEGYNTSKSADIWSLGILLYAMATGFFPFDGNEDCLNASCANLKNRIPDTYSPSLKDLIIRMICVSPYERISMEGIIQHPWFKN